ncbi:hypothetical protein LZP85_02225 [Priestia flexa]|uniref:Uncharacterized protein n=1 Tax=Priestia flexa TaxID=86664 RepID=A0A8I1MEC2_9BACI|nr:hypothetical protein [Priestia flexa]MBN8251184.1 hypothetical protein [Priestia flexa]MBN8433388.1 hypothetical protein [Priestia flexa]MCA0965914.1 hypothetical protein [Priestia flexa]UIR32301.1 hypothetical protein LZP85_02225 [Priestia flexa]UZW68080.1 hypothetical protein OC195_21900 [Priestia flexa]
MMGRSNRSKRFVKQGADAVQKHDERIPYHMTMAEAEAFQAQQSQAPHGGQ